MTEGKLKSRSFRRVKTRVPSSKVVTHYSRKKPSKPQCAGCGTYLHGTVQGGSAKVRNTAKSKRRPERPFGGQYCSKCSRRTILAKVRSLFGLKE